MVTMHRMQNGRGVWERRRQHSIKHLQKYPKDFKRPKKKVVINTLKIIRKLKSKSLLTTAGKQKTISIMRKAV